LSAPYYRFFVGDYLRDAGHLSLLEHGAYRRLIDLYMTSGEPLPFDLPRLYRLMHATSKEEQTAVQQVIDEFFRMDGNILRNSRCDRELAWQGERTVKSLRANDIKYAESRELKQRLISAWTPDGDRSDSKRSPYQNQNQNQNQKKTKTLRPSSKDLLPAGFREFWVTFPHYSGRSSRVDSLAEWKRMKLEPVADAVLETLRCAMASPDWKKDGGSMVPGAQRWLKKRLWEQDGLGKDGQDDFERFLAEQESAEGNKNATE
jgi:uncharacterized protein YdaU (DUF1376 family)